MPVAAIDASINTRPTMALRRGRRLSFADGFAAALAEALLADLFLDIGLLFRPIERIEVHTCIVWIKARPPADQWCWSVRLRSPERILAARPRLNCSCVTASKAEHWPVLAPVLA